MGAVQKCRSTTVPKKNISTVPKTKTLFNRAENMNKVQHIKCGKQKLNDKRLPS